MAISWTTHTSANLGGGALMKIYEVTFDASYVLGGETFDISADFKGSPAVFPTSGSLATTGRVVSHDHGTAAAGKLLVFEAGTASAPLDETDTTEDISALIVFVQVIGNGAV